MSIIFRRFTCGHPPIQLNLRPMATHVPLDTHYIYNILFVLSVIPLTARQLSPLYFGNRYSCLINNIIYHYIILYRTYPMRPITLHGFGCHSKIRQTYILPIMCVTISTVYTESPYIYDNNIYKYTQIYIDYIYIHTTPSSMYIHIHQYT